MEDIPSTPLGLGLWLASNAAAYVIGRLRKKRRMSAKRKREIAAARNGKILLD